MYVEAGLLEQLGHLLAAAELVDELLVEPGLVDAQVRVDHQAVAVEPLDVVALVGAAVAPDVDVVFLHRADEHGAGDGAAERRGVEVGHAGGGDVERAALQRGEALRATSCARQSISRAFSAPYSSARARDVVVVRLVGLAEVGGVAVGDRALLAHPVDGGAGVESAGERDADPFADRDASGGCWPWPRSYPAGADWENSVVWPPLGRGRPSAAPRGDFTATRRMLPITLLACVIGAIGAFVAVALLELIALFTNLFFFQRLVARARCRRRSTTSALASSLVPVVGGLIIGLMARYGSERSAATASPRRSRRSSSAAAASSRKVAVLKPLSSAISIGSGGPFGAEGPIIMTGGAFGSLIAQLFHLTAAERKTLLVAGAAAGMSATFGAPVAAVLLAVELLLFEWKPRSFVPVALASAVAAAAARAPARRRAAVPGRARTRRARRRRRLLRRSSGLAARRRSRRC